MGGSLIKKRISEETTEKGSKLIPISIFTSAANLRKFSNFFPEGSTNSLLSTNLTREIWKEYKNQTDAWDVSFRTCIFSGIANLDSKSGVYAGSHQGYTKFEKLFDKVI